MNLFNYRPCLLLLIQLYFTFNSIPDIMLGPRKQHHRELCCENDKYWVVWCLTYVRSDNIVANVGFNAGVTIEKKILGIWTEMYECCRLLTFCSPCVDNVGSCSYSDFCGLFHPNDGKCGPILTEYNLPWYVFSTCIIILSL